MAKTCADLFEGFNCTILGNSSEEVSGIAYRSDTVQPGDAFVCIVGLIDCPIGLRRAKKRLAALEAERVIQE